MLYSAYSFTVAGVGIKELNGLVRKANERDCQDGARFRTDAQLALDRGRCVCRAEGSGIACSAVAPGFTALLEMYPDLLSRNALVLQIL